MSARVKPARRARGPVPKRNALAVHARSRGMCERCYVRPATDIHHRQFRSRGGTHDVWNLLDLCGGAAGLAGGNHSGCHGFAHSGEGDEAGLSVHSWDDPAELPYRDAHGVAWRLLDDGTKERA